MSEKKNLKFMTANILATSIVRSLTDYCERIQIAGSVRRRRETVNDIDIVLIPKKDCIDTIKKICLEWHPLGLEPAAASVPAPKWGKKMASFNYNGIVPVDLYFATPETWPILLLIRTGSKEHNIWLCTQAKDKGMHLAADGSGLYQDRKKQNRVEGIRTEGDIFGALDLPHFEPEDREVDDGG